MAWLHATPKPDEPKVTKGKRRVETEQQPPKLSRIAQMKKDDIPVQMPPNSMPHIIARFIEIGMTEAAGMGIVPLTWREISAWQDNVAVKLDPWEARLIRNLSAAYVAENRKAESEQCPAPWRAEVTQRERELEIERLEMVLG